MQKKPVNDKQMTRSTKANTPAVNNLDNICRLADVQGNEDIKALSYAKFPGTHCPLFGVAMIASFISDLVVLTVGTGECTYYSKGFAYGNQKGRDNFFSLVIGKSDLTFGSAKKVLAALKEIEKDYHPAAIMVVTTCVLEVIGDDIESLLIENEMDFSAKLLCVNTEHFKCGSHIPGMERSLAALSHLMLPKTKLDKSINILGHRKHGVEETEVITALANEGVVINAVMPSNCQIKDIEKASAAALNVVTDFTALKLAERMEKQLGIPFVYFGRHLEKAKIDKEYQRIEALLEIELITHLEEKRAELDALEAKAKQLLGGKSFIYGNTPMMAFEVSDYLCTLGLNPLFIQVREYYDSERNDIDMILKRGFNPYVAQIANIAPMQGVYDTLKPDIYLGHENPIALFQKGVIQITADEVISKIGYEVPIEFLKKILFIYETALSSPDIPVGMLSMMGGMSLPNAGKTEESARKTPDQLLIELSRFSTEVQSKSAESASGIRKMPTMAEISAMEKMPVAQNSSAIKK